MGKKLIFLADAHLHPENHERAQSLFDFLTSQRAEADAIYILGDLFDYWVGARQCRRPAWAQLLERLGEIATDGPAIGILGGNRDYLLDAASLAPYGLESLGLEHRFERDGLRFCLVHGHRHFPHRWHARLFLRWIHGRFMLRLARTVPLWIALTVAGAMRKWRRWILRDSDPAKVRRYDPADFVPLFDAGAHVVICGHNHWARDYSDDLARPRCRLFAVGSWHDRPSYLEYADGVFRLVDPRL